jgi:hypothetical protein
MQVGRFSKIDLNIVEIASWLLRKLAMTKRLNFDIQMKSGTGISSDNIFAPPRFVAKDSILANNRLPKSLKLLC